MWETIKKHPVITGIGLIILVLLIRSKSKSANAGDPEYSSGTTIVGTPNPLGGVQLAQGSVGAGGSDIDSAKFFESQVAQAKSAQYASQTAALSGSNLDTLKTLLKRVGKGQDASFLYNEQGQLTGVDVIDNVKPVTSLKATQEQVKVWTAKLKANLLAQKRGAVLPFPEVGLGTNPATGGATVH